MIRRNGFQGLDFDLSTAVLSEYDEDGFLQTQVLGFAGSDSGSAPFEHHGLFGFLSRPRDPDASGACQVLFAATGDDCHVLPLDDPRFIPLVPPLKKGGSVQYCATGAFASLDGENGTYTIYLPFAGGTKALALSMDTEQESISIVHANGLAIVFDKDGNLTLKNKAGDGCIILNDSGVTINGNVTINGTLSGGPQLIALLSLLGANTKPPTVIPPVVNLTS